MLHSSMEFSLGKPQLQLCNGIFFIDGSTNQVFIVVECLQLVILQNQIES